MRKLRTKRSNDTPKISQLGRCGAVSDSIQAFRVCVTYHSAILPLKYTNSSHQEGKAHIQRHFPHTLVHRLQRWERNRQMMEAEKHGPLTESTQATFFAPFSSGGWQGTEESTKE